MASPAVSGVRTTVLLFAAVFLAAAVFLTANGAGEDGVCGMTQSELLECKPAVATGTAKPPAPTQPCCDALAHADLVCFCGFKKSKILPYMGINATRAMELPSVCNPAQTAHC